MPIAQYSLYELFPNLHSFLQPGDFVHSLGDAHVYTNHIAPLKKQVILCKHCRIKFNVQYEFYAVGEKTSPISYITYYKKSGKY